MVSAQRKVNLATLGWYLRDILGMPHPARLRYLRREVLDYLAGGKETTAVRMARALSSRKSDVLTVLRTLEAEGKIVSEPIQREGWPGRSRIVYRAIGGPSPGAGRGSTVSRNDYLRFDRVHIARQYLVSLARPSAPADAGAVQRLKRIITDPSPPTVVWREVYDLGLPPTSQGLVPFLLKVHPNQHVLYRVLRAYGLGGPLARRLRVDPSLALAFGVDLWEKGTYLAGVLLPQVPDTPEKVLEIQKLLEELFPERAIYQIAGFWPHRCQHEGHLYFADYPRQDCPAHSAAGRKARSRTSSHGSA